MWRQRSPIKGAGDGLGFLLLFLSLIFPPVAKACVSFGTFSTQNSSVSVFLHTYAPSHVVQGIQQGMAQWNNVACNTTGYDFPKFVAGSPTEGDIQVFYNQGISNRNTPAGSTACAFITGPGNGTRIELFSHFETANNETLPCPDTVISAADIFAHELGHYLGLAESPCSDHIMGPMSYSASDGGVVHYPIRSVQAAECEAADQANFTRRELCTLGLCFSGSGVGPFHDDPGDGSGGGGAAGNGPCYWNCYDYGAGLFCDLHCT